MNLIHTSLFVLVVGLALCVDSASDWKKLTREDDGGITQNQSPSAETGNPVNTRTTEKVKREVDAGTKKKERKKKGRVMDINIDEPQSSMGKSTGGEKTSRDKYSRIAASIDQENSKSEQVKGKGVGSAANSILSRKRNHEEGYGAVQGKTSASRDKSMSFTLDGSAAAKVGNSPPSGPGQNSPAGTQGTQGGNNGQETKQQPSQFSPPSASAGAGAGGGGGVGVASYKTENDQRQVQESGTKNIHEIIPMGTSGLQGQRQEQSASQKQTSSQTSRSESLIPVSLSNLPQATFALLPMMPQMGALPPMAPMAGMAPMGAMPSMPMMRFKRSEPESNGLDSDFNNDILNGKSLEGKERELSLEEPTNFHGSIRHTRNSHARSVAVQAIFHTVTGPDIDDAFKTDIK